MIVSDNSASTSAVPKLSSTLLGPNTLISILSDKEVVYADTFSSVSL